MHERLLIVKLSSLGDVIQAMPVIADVRRFFEESGQSLSLEWAVEEDYQSLLSLHPGVDRVIPVGLRRWRKAGLVAAWRNASLRAERTILKEELSKYSYDAIIDLQGLMKSAWVAQLAIGPRHGWDRKACRESLASFTYKHRYAAPPYDAMPAVHRYRELCADVLGYRKRLTDWPLDYGFKSVYLDTAVHAGQDAIAGKSSTSKSILFLHGSAREEKLWPEALWMGLGKVLIQRGFSIELGWGHSVEQERAWRIARGISADETSRLESLQDSSLGTQMLRVDARRLSLDEWPSRLASLRAVVGVDSGLLFLALACGVPALGIYLSTDPGHVGLMGSSPHCNLGGKSQSVSIDDVVKGLEALNVLDAV